MYGDLRYLYWPKHVRSPGPNIHHFCCPSGRVLRGYYWWFGKGYGEYFVPRRHLLETHNKEGNYLSIALNNLLYYMYIGIGQ